MASTLNLDNAQLSNMEGAVENYVITPKHTDGISNQKETFWTNPRWTIQWGAFNSVPDLKSALILKAVWNVGKGWTADALDTAILDNIYGWGKDSFDDILFNMDLIASIGGDSYAEIIRDSDTGELRNLKPLDPGSIRHVIDEQGIILRYEQINKLGTTAEAIKKFAPEDILHFSNNRLADQIHGISDIDAMEKTILAEEQSFEDMKKIMHRQARPFLMFKLKTDNVSVIDAFVAKIDKATNKGENAYIPDDENMVSYEVVEVNVSPTILAWRDDLRNKFYRAIGLPQLLPGATGGATESSGKIAYLAFEQIVEKRQSYIEKQIWNQLQIKIELIPPASMQPALAADQSKDGALMGMQPSDTIAGVGR